MCNITRHQLGGVTIKGMGTMLGKLLRNSAIFGFGASAGRAGFKGVSNNFATILVVVIIFIGLSFVGLFLMIPAIIVGFQFRKVWSQSRIIRFIIKPIIILGLLYSIYLLKVVVLGYFADLWGILALQTTLKIISASLTIGGFASGIAWADNVKKAAEIKKHNQSFFEKYDLTPSSLDKGWFIDKSGNQLKPIEKSRNKSVFLVAGRRGLRAAIEHQGEKLISYSGIRKLR